MGEGSEEHEDEYRNIDEGAQPVSLRVDGHHLFYRPMPIGQEHGNRCESPEDSEPSVANEYSIVALTYNAGQENEDGRGDEQLERSP